VKKSLIIIFSVVFVLLVFNQTVSAIPAFARKYGFNCNMCHFAFPKLSDFGQRFRDNGYQIPGQAGLEKTVFETAVPIALRTTAGYSVYGNGEGTASGFHLYGLDLLAAGVLHKNISFLFVYTPRLDEPAGNYKGKIPSYLASLESANVVFSNIVQDKLNLRIGRFEPGFQRLSSRRLFYILQPFEIDNFAGSRNSFDFSANQIGIEATGRLNPGLKYALGYINGSGANPDSNRFNDLYLVLSKTFGRGEGQSAGQRIGVFGYLGRQPTDFTDSIMSPLGDSNGGQDRTFTRLGGDISLNWRTFNLQATAFRGMDDMAFNDIDPALDYVFYGGVVQLDWAALADNRLVASLMYNWVRPPDEDRVHRIGAYSALLRYYLGSWSAVNVALHAEFTHRTVGSVSPAKENLFTVLLDLGF
jgi:hypothetical protein